eukprot:TRINITY_DN2685_c0_g1_i2.p1 TRINITY_DN2685_c0_g1~~TRINITY_DN2685_c0_g1_i2.p1  ORF type:complete len:174 (-),score=16.14 TRINITY_DN2685_c0_g1_i2:209-730(-)
MEFVVEQSQSGGRKRITRDREMLLHFGWADVAEGGSCKAWDSIRCTDALWREPAASNSCHNGILEISSNSSSFIRICFSSFAFSFIKSVSDMSSPGNSIKRRSHAEYACTIWAICQKVLDKHSYLAEFDCKKSCVSHYVRRIFLKENKLSATMDTIRRVWFWNICFGFILVRI